MVVVEGGRIAAVGGEVPAGAEVVDCGGGLLCPGFVDAHVHAVQGGLERIRCDLSEVPPARTTSPSSRRTPTRTPTLPWILGGGWAMAAFPGGTPTAADLDSVVPDRPVFLPNRDHHGAWVNTRALELAGITRETPDPPHGRFERDADGQPDRHPARGSDGRGVAARRRRPPRSTTAGCSRASPTCTPSASPGWQDAIVGGYAGMDDPGPTYLRWPRSAATSPPTSSGRCGGTATGARSRSSRWSSGGRSTPTAGSARPASR